MTVRRPHPASIVAVGIELVLVALVLLEQPGRTTVDSRIELTAHPGDYLAGMFTLWSPDANFGVLGNQGYGYLFPQGLWFVVADWLHIAPWVAQRLWSAALLVAACEGARRLARPVGLSPWPALAAGLAYALSVRMVSQVGVRSAEVLPMAVLPWVALPIVLALLGRMRGRDAAVLSAGAFALGGAANATASIAGLPLVVALLVWGLVTRRCGWRLAVGWSACIGAVSAWWLYALVVFGRFSPPFFDYVEDAEVVTDATGAAASLRGASNWINPLVVEGYAWWPAGHALSNTPWLVLLTAAIAACGLLGLAALRSPLRTPLAWSALIALLCLTIGHVATLDSPLSQHVRALLDGPLVPLRNVHKVDPALRLPLALGFGAGCGWLATAATTMLRGRLAGRLRPEAATALAGVVLLLAAAQPVFAGNLRTAGWTEIPDHWHEAAAFVAADAPESRTWVLPGAGFAIQEWGATLTEPIAVVGSEQWVSRIQVPLTPPATIRMLTTLEEAMSSGLGHPRLGTVLARLGIDHVLVRHDLADERTDVTEPAMVAAALTRSPGIERAATFGSTDDGPAIEVYRVTAEPLSRIDVRDVADAVTVSAAVDDVVAALGRGMIDPARPVLVQGDGAGDAPADLVSDAFQRRERAFGRVDDGYSAVVAEGTEPATGDAVTDYPGPPGARRVFARYVGIAEVTASSSGASTRTVGPVRPGTLPYAALDGDPATSWRSALFAEPTEQWWQVEFDRPQELHEVALGSRQLDATAHQLREVRFVAGEVSRDVVLDERGVARVDLGGVVADRLRIEVLDVRTTGELNTVAIDEVVIPGVQAERTLVVPETDAAAGASYLFGAAPPTRACLPQRQRPDCRVERLQPSAEAAGIDRTFHVTEAGEWRLTGSVVARPRPSSPELLRSRSGPRVVASSVLGNDPAVAARMAHDGEAETSWMSRPWDPRPTLTVRFDSPRRIDRIHITPPAAPAVLPTSAVIIADGERRTVDLTGIGTFEPIRAREVEIVLDHPRRLGIPLGVGELQLDGRDVAVPFDPDAPIDAPCGSGPTVVVGDRTYRTEVSGRMGDVVTGGPLEFRSCSGRIRLPEGEVRLQVRSSAQFQPTAVQLVGERQEPASRSREVRTVSSEATRAVVEVGPGEAALLSTAWNFNEGWRASVDGVTLEPQRVDGWSQGWVVPADVSGEVVIEYAPQRSFRIGLMIGLVVAVGMLLWAGAVLVRRLRSAGVDPPPTAPRVAGPGQSRLPRTLLIPGLVGLVALGWVFAGAAGLLAAVGCVLLARRRWWLLVPAGLLAAGAVSAAAVGGGIAPDWVDLLTGTGALLVLVRLCLDPLWPVPVDGEAR